jgi:hypothetical protein
VGIGVYLRWRYPPREAAERRERLADAIRRLTSNRVKASALHDALLLGLRIYHEHQMQEHARRELRPLEDLVSVARRDVDRAIASVRRVFSPDPAEVDALLAIREALAPVGLPLRRSRRGRPVEHLTVAHAALRRLHVSAEDRKDILDALFGDAK